MNKLAKIILLPIICFGALGNRGCVTTDTVILPEGPRATQLDKTKDDQITGLTAQVKAEQSARETEQMQASLAAADFETILFVATHLNPGLPRNAIEQEVKLGELRSPTPNPAEVIKGKERVIAILQNDVVAAQAAYGKAFDEAAQAKATIATKDGEIAKRDNELAARVTDITKLEVDKKAEQEAHKADVQKALDAKADEIAQIKKDYESKERATWVLWARILSLVFIAGGSLAIIVFKVVPEGAGLVGAGLFIGLLTMFVEWLTAQWWWPWLCGAILLGALFAAGRALYLMWKAHTLHDKTTKALQNLKDDAETLGTDTWAKTEEYLKYWIGDKTSFWGKAQSAKVAALGLVNPKAEESVKPNPPQT